MTFSVRKINMVKNIVHAWPQLSIVKILFTHVKIIEKLLIVIVKCTKSNYLLKNSYG